MTSLLSTAYFAFIFLLPGLLCARVFFPKGNAIQKAVFGISLSAAIFAIINFANVALSLRSPWAGISEYIALIVILILLGPKGFAGFAKRDAAYWRDALPMIGIAAFSVLWKLLFLLPIRNFASAYDYAGLFTGEQVPDLGFYTGMAADHSNYAIRAVNSFWQAMQTGILEFNITLIFMTIAYVGFVYILCKEYAGDDAKGRKGALWAASIMALGPIEIFYTSGSVFGHPMAYLAVFGLFYLFAIRHAERSRAALAIMLCLAMAATYYTSTMANIVLCVGFCLAIALEKIFMHRPMRIAAIPMLCLRDMRFRSFIIIGLISAGVFFIMSKGMLDTTTTIITDTQPIKTLGVATGPQDAQHVPAHASIQPYRDPNIMGISALRAQALLFLIFGAFFFIRLLRRREDAMRHAALASLPAAMAAFAFAYAGYPARAFDYLAFLAPLLAVVASTALERPLPRRFVHAFAACAFIVMASLGLLVMKDKKIFFDRSEGDLLGAEWIAQNLDGRILTDQNFASALISKGYYRVTGFADDDPRLGDIFYHADPTKFMKAVSSDFVSGKADYIATTRTMRDRYILMVNVPQIPIGNGDFIESMLTKVYDNGEVRVYSTDNASRIAP